MIKVSLVVPVYNTDQIYLKKCIESMLNQTLQDIEIIIINDGSTNNVEDVCKEYNDDRIVYIYQQNKGVSVARNIGIKNAKGKYIIFVDPDDYLPGDACETMYAKSEKYKVDILITSNYKHKEKLQRQNINQIKDFIINKNIQKKIEKSIISHLVYHPKFEFGAVWAKTFNRGFLFKNNLSFVIGLKKSQDRVFMLECLNKSKLVVITKYKSYFYRYDNEHSICNSYNNKIIDILESTLKEIKKYITNYHLNEEDYKGATSC